MGALGSNGHVSSTTVATDADVGSAGVASLAGQGFPVGVVGFTPSPVFNGNYAEGALIYSRGSGRLFSIQQGSGGLCAVVIATLSATAGGAVTGSTLLYVVAPAALGLAGSYTLLSLAVAAAPVGVPATFIVLAGSYTETAPFSLWGGCSVIGATPTPGYPGSVATNTNIIDAVMNNTLGIVSGAITFKDIQFSTSAVGNVWTSITLSATPVLFEGCGFDRAVSAAVIGAGASTANTVSLINCQFNGCYPSSLTSPFYAQNCYFSGGGSETFGNDSIIVDCLFQVGFFIGSGRVQNTRLTAGAITFNTPIVPAELALVNVQFLDAVATGPLVINGFGNAGTVRVNNCTTVGNITGTSWVASTITVVEYAGNGKYEYVNAPAASFTLSSFVDIAVLAPSVSGVVVTAPPASVDMPGRRIVFKNTSNDFFYSVIPAGGETIDGQSSSEPVWVAPQDSIELECDRTGSRWRILSQRGAKRVYSVAKPSSFVSGSFPTIAAAKVQIDYDRTVNPALTDPVIEIEAGVYVENVTFAYGVSIRGAGNGPSAVVIDGDLTLTANTDPVSVSNLTVTGLSTLSESTAGAITASNCIFDATGLGNTALSLNGTTATSLTRVFNCVIRQDAGNYGIHANTPQIIDISENRFEGASRPSIFVQACADPSVVKNNYMEGGMRISNAVDVLLKGNRHGVWNNGSFLVGIDCGIGTIIEDDTFTPSSATDVVISCAGANTAQIHGYRGTAQSIGLAAAAPFPNALRGMDANYIETYVLAGAGTTSAPQDVRIHIFTGTGPHNIDLADKGRFPQGAILYFLNTTASTITLTTTDGTPFVPTGATYPILAGTAIILVADVIGNSYFVASVG